MKVLLVSPNGSLDNGASLSLLMLAKLLTKNGIEVVVLSPLKGDLIDKLYEEGIKSYVINQYNDWYAEIIDGKKQYTNPLKLFVKMILNKIALKRIINIIKQENIDIVHVNALTTYLGAKAALATKKKLIWHIREFLEEDLKITFLYENKAYDLIRKSNYTVAISKGIFSKYKNLLNSNNIKLIYNGIDETAFYQKNDILNNSQYIKLTIAGRLVPEKGQMEFVKAINLLKNKGYKNLRALIIGSGSKSEYKSSLINYIQENELSDIISIQEYSSDMNSVWANTDIACICSKAEAFGRVTVEAMLEGILVIGANTGGTIEIIDDNETGYLYEQGNYHDLAEKIEKVINNVSQAQSIALLGQERALEKFTAKENARRIIELYKM